jgi:hypothetical protein
VRSAAGLIAAIALAWSAPALAQDASTDDEEEEVAPPITPTTHEAEATETTAPTEPAPAPQPAPEPSTSAPRSTPSAPAPQATSQRPVVIVNRRHHDDDEEEDEAPEPHSPPDAYDIVYVELFGGPTYVDLRAVQVRNYYPEFVQLSGIGGGGGVAAGFRIEFLSVGVRGTLSHYDVVSSEGTPSSFDVGTAAAEVTLSLPIPVVRPFIRAGFGLGWHGDAGVNQVWKNMAPPTDIQTTVFGWVFQGAIGLDVFVADWFSLGAAVSVDVLNMSRHAWSNAPMDLDPSTSGDVDFRQSGDAIGVQGRGQIAAAFHF